MVPLDFESANEVLIESLRAPARARPGQTVDLRLAIRSQREASGTVFLREGGEMVDLDPSTPGKGLAVSLEPGVRTISLPFPLADAGTHRFEAVFEPNDLGEDRVLENNIGTAVTFVEGPARVLVIDPSAGVESAPLVSALTQASIPVVVVDPSELRSDSAFLSGFDAIILVNLPRWKVDGELDRLLRAYVHDVGGGLLVLGGPEALGAGGWISSDLAEALPVNLDPPGTRAYLRGSVAIVLDSSGSMSSPAMGAFAHKQAMANESAAAGVRSMSPLDEVCVIAFSGTPEVVVPRRAVGRDSFVERNIRRITGVPKIGGYTVTVPRAGLAELHIVQPSTEAVDPIFASWNYGLGRAAVFTSDAGARWATQWPDWAEYRAFWEQTVRWLMRAAAPSNAAARTRIDGERAIVELELTRADGGFDLVTQPDGAIVAPDGTLRALPLEQVGAGRWRGEFGIAESGTYLASFALAEDDMGRRTSVFTAADAPYAREFRTTSANRALLEQVAARTGGRVIELDSAAPTVDAFLRSGTATPLMSRGLWDLLAMLAAVLFLLDAAVRRMLFDWTGVREAARGTIAQRTPSQATLGVLERIRSRRARGDGTSATPAAPAATEEPGADRSTASRLMQAKRRAAGQRDDGEAG